MLNLEGPLFFGTMESLLRTYTAAGKYDMLIIDISKINMIDLSGIFALEDLISNIKSKGIKVLVTGANSYIKRKLEKVGFIKKIGKNNFQESKNHINPIIQTHFSINP